MGNKIIIVMIAGLIFVFSATIIQAQKRTFIPPENTEKKYSYMRPELQVDSTFIANLNTILFNENDGYMNNIISNPQNSQHFHIHFEKKDTLNYCIVVSLWNTPLESSIGFFRHNGFYYWFDKDAPPNIILCKKNKKQFSYTEDLIGFIDPPFWYLIYNYQTGKIETSSLARCGVPVSLTDDVIPPDDTVSCFMSCQVKKENGNVVLSDFTKELISLYINDVENINAKNRKDEIIIIYVTDTSHYYLSVFANNSKEYKFCREDFVGQTLHLGHLIKVFGDTSSIFYSVNEKIKKRKRCNDNFTEYDPFVWYVCLYKDKSLCKTKTYKVNDYEDITVIQNLVEKYFGDSNVPDTEAKR
jgi:hypothetical protein